jgi:hypothetical protein
VLEDLALDAEGRLLLAGGECEQVLRYDPRRKRFERAAVPGVLDARAVGFAGERPFATSTSGRLFQLEPSPLTLGDTFSLGRAGLTPFESVAVSMSDDGALWVLSAQGAGESLEHGLLTRFDPEARRVTDQVEVGLLARGQGDLTGSRSVPVFTPEARVRRVFGGCGSRESNSRDGGTEHGSLDTRWLRAHVSALVGSGASVALSVRHADTVPELQDARFQLVGELPRDTSPFELSLPNGGVIEAQLELRVSDGAFAPRVSRVGIEHSCVGPE